jgi:hypothetical protein
MFLSESKPTVYPSPEHQPCDLPISPSSINLRATISGSHVGFIDADSLTRFKLMLTIQLIGYLFRLSCVAFFCSF